MYIISYNGGTIIDFIVCRMWGNGQGELCLIMCRETKHRKNVI